MVNGKIKIRENGLANKNKPITAIHLLKDLEIKIKKLFLEVKETDKAMHIM